MALHQFSLSMNPSDKGIKAHPYILKNVVSETYATKDETLSQRGLDLLTEGFPAEAAQLFCKAIAAESANFEAYHGLIRALRGAGRPEQSIASALALIALNPNDPLAHTALSIWHQCACHVPEAEAAAVRARVLEWRIQLQSPPSEEPAP